MKKDAVFQGFILFFGFFRFPHDATAFVVVDALSYPGLHRRCTIVSQRASFCKQFDVRLNCQDRCSLKKLRFGERSC